MLVVFAVEVVLVVDVVGNVSCAFVVEASCCCRQSWANVAFYSHSGGGGSSTEGLNADIYSLSAAWVAGNTFSFGLCGCQMTTTHVPHDSFGYDHLSPQPNTRRLRKFHKLMFRRENTSCGHLPSTTRIVLRQKEKQSSAISAAPSFT